MDKGQASVGGIIILFIAVIVGLTLFTGGITDPVYTLTKTIDVGNTTYTWPAINGNLTMRGQAISTVIVTNATEQTLVLPSTNYTIWNNVLSNGELISKIQAKNSTNGTGGAESYHGQAVNISYTFQPYGYQTSGGYRSIIELIVLFAALTVAIVVIVPSLRNGVLDLVGK